VVLDTVSGQQFLSKISVCVRHWAWHNGTRCRADLDIELINVKV